LKFAVRENFTRRRTNTGAPALSVELAPALSAKTRRPSQTVPAVRISTEKHSISKTYWRRERAWSQTFSGSNSMIY